MEAEKSIEEYEIFIDEYMEKSKYETLKKQLFGDLYDSVFRSVKRAVKDYISTNYKKTSEFERSDLEDTIEHLKTEIEFYQNEINEKNKLLHFLATKSVFRDETKNSFTDDYDQNASQNCEIFQSPEASLKNINACKEACSNNTIVDNEKSDNISNDSLIVVRKNVIKKKLCDQLLKIRQAKHNTFLNSKKANDKSYLPTITTKDTKTTNTANNSKTVLNEKKNISSRQRVIICGDSMVNGLDGNGVSSKVNQVNVRSFSGATSEDMVDYCKPLVNKKPDILILHVGTNDLTKKIENTSENLVTIINYAKQMSPNTELILSNICLRKDDPKLEHKRKRLNDTISKTANDFGLQIIDNKNIDSSCLAKKKLHLNAHIGMPRLAKNIKNHLQQYQA